MYKTSIQSKRFKLYWPKSRIQLIYVTWMKCVDPSLNWFVLRFDSRQISSCFIILKASITFFLSVLVSFPLNNVDTSFVF